jgi:hypothetical protein
MGRRQWAEETHYIACSCIRILLLAVLYLLAACSVKLAAVLGGKEKPRRSGAHVV